MIESFVATETRILAESDREVCIGLEGKIKDRVIARHVIPLVIEACVVRWKYIFQGTTLLCWDVDLESLRIISPILLCIVLRLNAELVSFNPM